MTCLTVKPNKANLMNRRTFNHNLSSMPDISEMFDSFFSNQNACHPGHHTFWPAVDIHELDDEVTITMEAPGMTKDEIKVTVKENILTIEGKRELHSEPTEVKLLVNEIRTGDFSRKFTLPKTIDTSKIKADFSNGLLKISLAKLEEIKPKEIEVSVK